MRPQRLTKVILNLCRSAAQSLGVEPLNLLLDASQAAPTAAPALTGLSAGLSNAGSLVNQTISGVRADLQSVAARLNLTVSQVRGNPVRISSSSQMTLQQATCRLSTHATLLIELFRKLCQSDEMLAPASPPLGADITCSHMKQFVGVQW